MLNSTSKIIIAYFTHNKLNLFYLKKEKQTAKIVNVWIIDFSDEEIKNGHISDSNLFVQKIVSFILSNKLKIDRVIILLSEHSLFIKGYKTSAQSDKLQIQSQFLSEIPYPAESLILKSSLENDSYELFAVEKELVLNLKLALEKVGAKIETILALPKILALSYPAFQPTILIVKQENDLIFLYLDGQTIFLSETKEATTPIESTILTTINAINKSQLLSQTKNVLLLNITSPLLIEQLSDNNYQFQKITFEGDLIELAAGFWFNNKNKLKPLSITISQQNQDSSPKRSFKLSSKLIKISVSLLLIATFVFILVKFLILPRVIPKIQPQEAEKIEKIASKTPKITPIPTPTTATVSAKPQDFKVEILNGNGIAGDAAKAKQLLETEGFVVVNTANAQNSDSTLTEILAKTNVDPKIISSLDKILQQSYTQTKIATLQDDAKVDIQIILGSKK